MGIANAILKLAQEEQYQQNQKDESHAAGRGDTPPDAIRPEGCNAYHQKDKQDQQHEVHHVPFSF
jgi:hypothetical protein